MFLASTGFLSFLEDPITAKVVMSLAILIAGFLLAKLFELAILKINKQISRKNETDLSGSGNILVKVLKLIIYFFTLILALNYLTVEAGASFMLPFWESIPRLIGFVLILFLGALFINVLINVFKTLVQRIEFREELEEIGLPLGLVEALLQLIKLFFYFVVFSLGLNYLGFSIPFIDNVLVAVSFAVVLLITGFCYYSFKESIKNFLLRPYIKSTLLKPGQHIKVGDIEGEVVEIGLHGVSINTIKGYDVLIPHAEIIQKIIFIKRTKKEMQELNTLRLQFVASKPYYSAPACAKMVLSLFGFKTTQKRVGELAGTKEETGTASEKLIKAVGKISMQEVKGEKIKYTAVKDLALEAKTWISDKALIALWFKKPTLEGLSGKGNYAVCLGVEGEELIVMDLTRNGAVYLVNGEKIREEMNEFGQQGFIVFAKKGTPAYYRIKEKIFFLDTSLYNEIGKAKERYLKKLDFKSSEIKSIISHYALSAEESAPAAKKK